MQLSISHKTTYRFERSLTYGLQQIRLTPKTPLNDTSLDWNISVKGGEIQVGYKDHHNNQVHLIALDQDANLIEIISEGSLEVQNTNGIIGPHKGFVPLWYFQKETPLTLAGKQVNRLLKSLGHTLDQSVDSFHKLSKTIAAHVKYKTGTTNSITTAEDALSLGTGVCQDHAHIFIAAARKAGFPARYISGYLMMNDRVSQDATHAWAEVYLQDLGWVGFDASNGISPDERYVRVASGLDYREAAPISGMTYGGGGESLSVNIQVQQ